MITAYEIAQVVWAIREAFAAHNLAVNEDRLARCAIFFLKGE